ncbi:MAG: SDR family NAD(P)-dependent oxidoreductase, partial [Thiotrichaceae bacterium]|nr:SDR family NAD(P)-dependent oxidoreductase [Thiotrichaceae bacterium]
MVASKTVFITGCSTGIGYTTAIELKKRGHRVICSARQQSDVSMLKEQGFEALQLDLAQSSSIQQAVEQLIELTDGKIDGLFNNGAFGQPGAVEDLSR